MLVHPSYRDLDWPPGKTGGHSTHDGFVAFVGGRALQAIEVVACYSNTSFELTFTCHRIGEVALEVLFFHLEHFAHERQGADLLIRLWYCDGTWATGRSPWTDPTDIAWKDMPFPTPPTQPQPLRRRRPIQFSEIDKAELEALFAQNPG